MEPIRQSSRERRLERALLVIEGLTYLYDDAEEQPDGSYKTGLPSQVYRIAHAALAYCCASDDSKHDGCNAWLDEIEEAEKALKELNILNVEKIVSPS
jgi:hypothetical protein